MTIRRSVYASGAITGLSFKGATDWRQYVSRQLALDGIDVLSPLRHKEYLTTEVALADTYDHHPMSTGKGITTRDRWDAMRCDLFFLNLLGTSRVSIGSMIEVGWADAARVPIVCAMEPDNLHDHAILRECCGFILPTLDEAVDIARWLLVVPHPYGPNAPR